jgi:GntR family transcriptional repressor for pyruvate dehydrogenase complex
LTKKVDVGVFREAKGRRSSDAIVGQIRTAVLSGRLKKGDRLPNERELCQIFAVSRPTLREGLRTLEALGVIATRLGSGGGIFVSEPGEEQVGAALEALLSVRKATGSELAEFRVSFEGETAYWAAVRASKQQIAELEEVVEEFAACAADDSEPWGNLVRVDMRFHELVAHASQNQVRTAIMRAIYRAIYDFSLSLAPMSGRKVRLGAARQLREIAAAIREHDGELARTRMRRHIKRFAELDAAAARDQTEVQELRSDSPLRQAIMPQPRMR